MMGVHTETVNIIFGQSAELQILKQVAHIAITVLLRVNCLKQPETSSFPFPFVSLQCRGTWWHLGFYEAF
jgi:hypothetical protein